MRATLTSKLQPTLPIRAGKYVAVLMLTAPFLTWSVEAQESALPQLSQAKVQVYQQQAQAVTSAASQTQKSLPKDFLTSPAISRESSNQAAQHASIVDTADPSALDKLRTGLPASGGFGDSLKYGKHVVVSSDGPEVIALIHQISVSDAKDHEALLERLQVFVANHSPEAINFMGFLLETGSMGYPKDTGRAAKFYQLAASSNYQPAIYNLALVAGYGKNGKADLSLALNLLSTASALGPDTSQRICGMASFISFRMGQQDASRSFARDCLSPLARLAPPASADQISLPNRIALLRGSLAAGVDDAYPLIEQIAKAYAGTDINFTYCKYALLNRLRSAHQPVNLNQSAQQCLEQLPLFQAKSLSSKQQIIAGVSSFIPSEMEMLKQMRQSNRFHYGWPAPFLPFPQQEVDLLERLVPKNKP